MGDLNKNILRWVLILGSAPVWWPFLRILWQDFNSALRDEGGLFGNPPGGRELERIQRERAAAPPTLTHEPYVRAGERRSPRMRAPARRTGPGPQPARKEKGPGRGATGGRRFR